MVSSSVNASVCQDMYGGCYQDSPVGYVLLNGVKYALYFLPSNFKNSKTTCTSSAISELFWFSLLPGYTGKGLCYVAQAPPRVPVLFSKILISNTFF